MSAFADHLTASNIGETGSILSRMRSTGFAGASIVGKSGIPDLLKNARILDRIDPLAKLAAMR